MAASKACLQGLLGKDRCTLVLMWVVAECKHPTSGPGHIRGGCGVLCGSRKKERERERQERYPTIKTITKGAGKHRDEATEGEPILSAWHLDPAGAD